MSLAKYLGEGKMEVLYQEIESSIEIQLKIIPYWLISKSWLEEYLKSRNRRKSAIVITVKNNKKASRLCSKELRFGETLKVVKKYWEVGFGSIYMSCAGISHDRLGKCRDKAI